MTETIVVPKFSLYLYKQNKFACFIRSYGCQYSVDENEKDSDCNSIAAKLLYCRFSKFARIVQRSIKKCIKKKVFKKLRNNRIIQKFNWNVSTTRYDKDHYNIPYSDTCSDTCSDIDTCSDTCSEIDSEYYDEIEYDILNTIQRKRGKCISKKVLSL
jgi:hypothetical protein